MTHRIRVDLGARGYDVVVGAGAITELATVLNRRRRVAVVTQEAVGKSVLVGAALAGVEHDVFTIAEGEDAKTLATVDDLCRAFASSGLLRGDAVVAVGGGVVGDTAGFAASVYARGIDVVQVPTTLLAMVDAAIGGKTGVNLPEGKNLVGAFHQPLAVLADPSVLATLPAREFSCGLGEVAKYTLMEGTTVDNSDRLLAREPDAIEAVVAHCAAIKARYVEADEYERSGQRAALNYGHTVAHAIETASGHALLHGEAVAVGLVFAGALAGVLERIPPAEVVAHEAVVAELGLPTTAPGGLRRDDLLAIMKHDKKATGGLTFVLRGPNGIERVDDPDPAAVCSAFAAIGVEG